MTFFCELALLLFASSVKLWPILYSELYNLPMDCMQKVFLLFEYPYFSFCSMIFFSSALEKVITVVNYLFHTTPVIYFPDLNYASLLLIQNLMYSNIWIMCFFPVLSVSKLIYMRFETRGTTTAQSSNENPYSGIMLLSVFPFSPTSLQFLMKANVIITVATCYS